MVEGCQTTVSPVLQSNARDWSTGNTVVGHPSIICENRQKEYSKQ